MSNEVDLHPRPRSGLVVERRRSSHQNPPAVNMACQAVGLADCLAGFRSLSRLQFALAGRRPCWAAEALREVLLRVAWAWKLPLWQAVWVPFLVAEGRDTEATWANHGWATALTVLIGVFCQEHCRVYGNGYGC